MDSSDLAHLQNTAATFDEISSCGKPSIPLDFPDPVFSSVTRVNASVLNPTTNEESVVPNVFYAIRPDGMPPPRAYWIGRKLKKAIYGCVRSCTVLKVREGGWAGSHGNSQWEITSEMAAVKIIDLEAVQELRGSHIEDPIKEVAAMQFLSSQIMLYRMLCHVGICLRMKNIFTWSCHSVQVGNYLLKWKGMVGFRSR